MKFLTQIFATMTLLLGATPTLANEAGGEGKPILVILSGEDKIRLNGDKTGGSEVVHETGFFLTELMVPLKILIDNGFVPIFATPAGTRPIMDAISDNAFWFGGDEEEYRSYRDLCEDFGLCGKERVGVLKTESFSDVVGDLDKFFGVFLPGGHAPMEDLYKDRVLGTILKHFHRKGKPTALICHAPVALLSSLDRPDQFGRLLEELNELSASPRENQREIQVVQAKLFEVGKNWIYRDYKMTSFSTKEERQEEPGGADDVLGGYMKFYVDEALDFAGGNVLVRAQKWQSNVVVDRELITGQNPFSDKGFAEAFLKALSE